MPLKVYHSNGKPDYLLLLDFDETYYPHELKRWQLKNLYELEDYLENLLYEKNILIGWVTDSSLVDIHKKMKAAGMNYLPHFIASNLGTEYWELNQDGEYIQNKTWCKKIKTSGFCQKKVEDLVLDLKQIYGIDLQKQTQFGQQTLKMNYYYFIENSVKTKYAIDIIRTIGASNGVYININRCNPLAGDPDNAYDVDFIPQNTGKRAVAQFAMEQFRIPYENTLAFGDSGNDIEMLKAVKHGYLLQNATEEAKQLHLSLTSEPYANGIKKVCMDLF